MPKPYFRSNYAEVKTQFEGPFDNCVCIPLTKGQHTIIDVDDFDKVAAFIWYAKKAGGGVRDGCYSVRSNLSKPNLLHRLILNNPQGMLVDHKNGNPLDNRKANLRDCGPEGNSRNRAANCYRKYKGVFFHKNSGKWYARIKINGKLKIISSHSSDIEAAKAYDQAALKYYKEFARINIYG